MITSQDVWCVHIIPQLGVEDLFALYQTSRRAAELVEMARDWNRLYARTFDGLYIDAGTPFLSFLSRHRARVVDPNDSGSSNLVNVACGIKTIAGAFEQSMLAVLDVEGGLHCNVHAQNPQHLFTQVYGLDHYLYGLEADGTVNAWTSAACAPVRFRVDATISKVCSVGYLCAALTDRGIYWWQKPHGAFSKMEYERLSVPVQPEDLAVTRYGIVFIAQHKLYELRLLDWLLRPVVGAVECLGSGYARLEQSGEWFVAHGLAHGVSSTLMGNGCETRTLHSAHSVQAVGSSVWTLDSEGSLSCDGQPVQGRYSQMTALKNIIYAIRVD